MNSSAFFDHFFELVTYRMVGFRLWQRSKFGLVEELMMFKRIYVGLTENDSFSFFYLFIKSWEVPRLGTGGR
jgi:hypothetical protein